MAFESGSTERKAVQHGGAVAAGAYGGPAAAALWEVGSPLVMDWIGGNGQDDAEAAQRAGMQHAADMYSAYRPQVSQARNNALQGQLSAYNGAGNALGLMYGTQYNPANYAPNIGQNPWEGTTAPQVAPAPAPEKPKKLGEQAIDYAKEHPDEAVATAAGPMGWGYIGAKKLWNELF